MQREAAISDTREFIEKNNIEVASYLDIDDDNMLMAMVEKDLGISIIPDLACQAGNRDVNVYKIKPEIYRELGITVTNPKFMSPATKLLKQEIEQYIVG